MIFVADDHASVIKINIMSCIEYVNQIKGKFNEMQKKEKATWLAKITFILLC